MCTYAEEAWHQEADSEKEGGKFAEAGPPPVGSGVDTGVAGQVSQAHHPLRAARRHPRGLCAVGLFFNLLQPSLVRVLKGSLSRQQTPPYGRERQAGWPHVRQRERRPQLPRRVEASLRGRFWGGPAAYRRCGCIVHERTNSSK